MSVNCKAAPKICPPFCEEVESIGPHGYDEAESDGPRHQGDLLLALLQVSSTLMTEYSDKVIGIEVQPLFVKVKDDLIH